MEFNQEVIIGLETHIEVDTLSKLFCCCPRTGIDTPNSRVCPICLGHPGARPFLNGKVLAAAVKLALAIDGQITEKVVFSRKNYFYPDMAKNFQITQFESPLSQKGSVKLNSGKLVKIRRLHIEEDPASLVYPKTMRDSQYVLIDYNRSGIPLIELVTEPSINSPREAREYMNKLMSILSYLKIFDVNSCVIKSDANISIRDSDYTRVEIKNISGIKEIEKALSYELMRQRSLIRRGIKIVKETRGWNKVGKTTFSQRTKESEEDYGYISEPDLPEIVITPEYIRKNKDEIPELPAQKQVRFVEKYKLNEDDSFVLTKEPEIADLFENVAKVIDSNIAANWIRGEVLRVLNYNKKRLNDSYLSAERIIDLLKLLCENKISKNMAQNFLERMITENFSLRDYILNNNISQISDDKILTDIAKKVLNEEKIALEDYLSGKEKALDYIIGKCMALSKSKADPIKINKILLTLIRTR